MSSVAVFYKGDAFDTSGRRLVGRQAAGEGFLKGLVQHGTAEPLYCYTGTQAEFQEFCDRITPWQPHPQTWHWLPADQPQGLEKSGLIFRPDSVISNLVWERRFLDQRSYSICGVTHSIASKPAMEDLGKLLLAPVQPWDALICPSVAVKTVVEKLWQNWSEYLAQRTGGQLSYEIQLPVIPLGVDCAAFAQGETAQAIRRRRRQDWGIGANDIVVLYIGRLSLSTKAHPVPMCMALERAKQATGANVCLLLVGWFESQMESALFQESVQAFCPSVNALCLDGRSPDIRRDIWSVADLFMSLADNVQETFGLTPIEAMAAGLPAVVADWNGYQTSVRHELDGFKIPTSLPPAGTGLDLALGQLNDTLAYSQFAAYTAMMAAVDVEACTQALIKLMQDESLRKRMGDRARQYARQTYDWKVVIAAYERLWQELAEIRAAAASVSVPRPPEAPPYPLCDDPFRVFAHYSTNTLTADSVVGLGETATPPMLNLLRRAGATNLDADRRLSPDVVDAMISAIAETGSLPVSALLRKYGRGQPNRVLQTIAYLLKFDVLRLR